MSVCAILLAAGASSRMRGTDKLMEPIGNRPLIVDRWNILASRRSGARLVVLPPDKPARHSAMAAIGAHIVINPDAQDGMASSVIAGLEAVPSGCNAALFMPADMPLVSACDIDSMRDAHSHAPNAIIRAADDDGKPGNPVLFPRQYFADLKAIRGDEGGRAVIQKHADKVKLVTLPGAHATLDLDTPEDWATWRAQQS